LILRRLIADLLFARGHAALAASLDAQRPEFARAAALAARDAGRGARARRYAERALAINPRLDDMHRLLSNLELPGEDYLALLARLHAHLRPRTYLEVGVSSGKSLRLVAPGTRAIGVDPQPRVALPLPPDAKVFAESSDAFFAQRDVKAELGGLPVELAFIDGMHHFEFALRDFMNLERLCTRDSVILLHDCYPWCEIAARRERASGLWTGDVWRVVPLLKEQRPDLEIHTIAAPPSGLCMVRNLDPASRLIADNLEALCARYRDLDYRVLASDPAGTLNLFPNDWGRVEALLGKR